MLVAVAPKKKQQQQQPAPLTPACSSPNQPSSRPQSLKPSLTQPHPAHFQAQFHKISFNQQSQHSPWRRRKHSERCPDQCEAPVPLGRW
ncbi:hypothetical protein O3P69_017228 [Scylla paramamosain]|uniref:Uncharacterized protein n=1 Tax=Scylla paramamosain TaxID=85552 RepID=A0AAW0TUX0_SCYPA